MKALISVILPVFNQEKYIAETIESVLSQSYEEFELLIIDDGSTDNSAQIIHDYAARDKRIQAFYQVNSGRCIATNRLVEKAKGDWCAFLDADDVMIPNRLEKQLGFHMENNEIDASSCHCYYINENGKFIGFQRYPNLKTVDECKKAKAKNQQVLCAITGMMFKKKIYAELGGLRDNFWPCDDADFVNRIVEQGYILVIIQNILMKYRIHQSSATTKSQWYMFDKLAYTHHCCRLRIEGRPEILFEEYIKEINKIPWWRRLNQKKLNYSIYFHKEAGFSYYSSQYLKFIMQIASAFFLSPSYIIATLCNRIQFTTSNPKV